MARLLLLAVTIMGVAIETVSLVGGQKVEFVKAYKSDYDKNKLPDYPGLMVYHELEEIVSDKVKTNSLETNMDFLEDLSNKLPHRLVKPKALIDAVRLVLTLKYVVEEQRCDSLASRAAAINLNAVATAQEELIKAQAEADQQQEEGDQQQQQQQQEKPKDLARLAFLIKHYYDKLVLQCVPLLNENLDGAVKLIEDDAYNNLTAYLSEEFISKWTEKGKSVLDIGIHWGQMNLELNWSRRPFNQQELMLRQLFRLTQEHPQPLHGRELYFAMNSGDKWPKIVNQDIMKALIQAKITKPCMSYLKQVDANVFKLMYGAAKYYGHEWAARLLEKGSHHLLANLFRYEFCHFEVPIIGHQLWKFYWDSTNGMDVVHRAG